jgi:hypothetical protein
MELSNYRIVIYLQLSAKSKAVTDTSEKISRGWGSQLFGFLPLSSRLTVPLLMGRRFALVHARQLLTNCAISDLATMAIGLKIFGH